MGRGGEHTRKLLVSSIIHKRNAEVKASRMGTDAAKHRIG